MKPLTLDIKVEGWTAANRLMFSSLTLSICDIWMFKFYFSCFFSKKINTQCLVIENCQNVPKSFIMFLSVKGQSFSRKKKSPKPPLLIFHSVLSLRLIIDCDFFCSKYLSLAGTQEKLWIWRMIKVSYLDWKLTWL